MITLTIGMSTSVGAESAIDGTSVTGIGNGLSRARRACETSSPTTRHKMSTRTAATAFTFDFHGIRARVTTADRELAEHLVRDFSAFRASEGAGVDVTLDIES